MRTNKMIMVLLLLVSIANLQQLAPNYLLPIQTTQNSYTDYAFSFYTDTNILNNAYIQVDFPYEFDPRYLNLYTSCKYSFGNNNLQVASCKLILRSFFINVNAIYSGNITILIKNIRNPNATQMSSNFCLKTLFKSVVVTQNLQFGKTPFTLSPISSASGIVYNYQNTLVEQGSTWIFNFTLAGSYESNSTIRFVFPDGFSSNKIQCNISGVTDSSIKTRVFPQGNIYDCLNINTPLSGSQFIVLSGIVNPNFQMTISGLKVEILQPNGLVVKQIVGITNQPLIKYKNMNATITIPNNFRNNTITYIFQINIDSDLTIGDYIQLKFSGNWTFFIQDSKFIQGIESTYNNKATFVSNYSQASYSILYISNFSSISRQKQIAFYVSMKTPLNSGTYPLTITAFRSFGGIAQQYSQNLIINATTGYIRQMRLHPMTQSIKLPVGQTGPLQITLGLMNNLPQTNVLTYGKVVIQITPSIPIPIVAINGVPKCYFYGNIDAKNCTYTVNTGSTPSVTTIIAYTPVDFNFQSSEVPFMVTTQGYVNSSMQGLTIDTLVKRYHFHIQFYSDYSPEPIPTQVVFSDWIADPIGIQNFACAQLTRRGYDNDHLKCTFITPNQILNDAGHIHIFRLEFMASGWYSALGYSSNQIYPDYPCLIYGANIIADPYVKCDLVTWTTGPYMAEHGFPYINIYGMQTIPALSQVTIQIPGIKKGYYYSGSSIDFTIQEDTYGYQPPFIKLYEQVLPTSSAQYQYYNPPLYTSVSVSYTMSNPIVNKINTITLTSFDLTTTGISYVIFEVDQNYFPDIGRQHDIICGSHLCSKFNKPVQYFILYPQSTLSRYQNLVFPNILNPSQAGSYTFKLRAYNSNKDAVLRYSFSLTIQPDTITTLTYGFNTLLEQSTSQYPNTDRYYKVSWTIVNSLPALTAYIEIYFDNYFTLSSDYCQLQTTVSPYYGNQIPCNVNSGSNKVVLSLMKSISSGSTFTLTTKMITTTSASTFTPTVTIYTKVSGGSIVDQRINYPLTLGPITNTNLVTLTSFSIKNPFSYNKKITKGYFGDLIINFQPRLTSSVTNGYYMAITLTSEFYPYSNVLNLPLNCQINGIRFSCSYTLNPFKITINNITNKYSTSSNIINITTSYLQKNGIYHPANPGRYLLNMKILDISNVQQEVLQQYIDIKPKEISYFNASYAHRDIGKYNIFTFQFYNGQEIIPAYNDPTNASKIYIGFPLKDDSSANVFTYNLGFTDLPGYAVPCFSQNGTNFITPISGKQILCKLHQAPYGSNYAYVQIINFAQIIVGQKMRVFMGKVLNPSSAKVDINFKLKIVYRDPISQQQQNHFQSDYNMFIDMLNPSVTSRTQPDSTSVMFQSGSQVGDSNKFINHIPYTGGSGFKQNDWFIIDMYSQFPLSGSINNCLPNFYKYCIIFKEVNWLAIKINNGTLIPLYPFISSLPTSISRVNTNYFCYTFISQRWSETITYTITAAQRWMELRGSITNFAFEVLGSQNKLNIGQKNVDVLISFYVTHSVNKKGTIQIQFPNNSTLVPSIKPHCRSAVTLGSALNGDPTGKPAVNIQGEIGCSVQNSYSWIITSFDTLSQGSQVKIFGQIDFPTILTSSLGTGYIATYSNEDATSVFINGRTIDYIQTSFPLQIQNKTWNLDIQPTMTLTQPLRINYKGPFTFKLQVQSTILNIQSGGYIDVNLWQNSILGYNGGFGGPTSQVVCLITSQSTGQKIGCQVSSASFISSTYYTYRIQSVDNLAANTVYYVTLTTQNGNSNEGINFPTVVGTYKFQVQIDYSSASSTQISKAHFFDVYGPAFNVLNIYSTVSIPQQLNLLLFQIIPSSSITNNIYKLVIQIPTVGIDGTLMFDNDLGIGYKNYDDLIFDLYQSSLTSMKCKVYLGDQTNNQPIRIVCNQFSLATITSSHIIKFGFWVKNPSSSIGLAIPAQVYFEHVYAYQKNMWQIIQGAIRVLPTSVSPINDYGNFALGNTFRQISGISFYFTNRNTKPLLTNDLYVLKFNFDLRNSDKIAGTFKYPYSAYSNSGDTIFLPNSRTIILRVGGSSLANVASGFTNTNVLLNSIFYNPSIQLTASQSQITSYAVYFADQSCQKITYKDSFPTLVPNEPTSPTFTMSPINGNTGKWQRQDYKFTFKMSTSVLSDLSLVKKISIQFPALSVYDLKFSGTQCIEDFSSDIQIKKCFIDASTYTIWIDPVQKASYINSHQLIFQTVGLAIINPSNSSINLNNFVVRYYTWPKGTTPTIFPNSDDYVFMKQDSTNLASVISFTSTAYNQHTSIQFANQLYINQFLPTDTTTRTPFQFKFIAMTTFNNYSGTTNYHQIRLKFGDYYTYNTLNQATNDLYINIPVCQLNGDRILQCSITSTQIIMNFLHPLTSGSQVSVKFSVLNPVDAQQDGFTLLNLNTPIITLPIRIKPYGATNYYYIQAQNFPAFYTPSAVAYPSMGISAVSLSFGTQVYNKLNYLDFTLSFSRNDINGLVLQIPLIKNDGSLVYTNPILMGLDSGSEYPCSVGISLDVYCYYQKGSTTGYGTPTRIYISKFAIQAGNTLSLRLLFTNPDIIGVFPSFIFKAFGGTISNNQLMGRNFMGQYQLNDAFKTYPNTSYYSTSSSCQARPTLPLWNDNTNYIFYLSDTLNTGNYAILQWVLNDPTYGKVSTYTVDNTQIYDWITVSWAPNNRKVYLIKKQASTSSFSSLTFGHLRNTHFLQNSNNNLYLLTNPSSILYNCPTNQSYTNTYKGSNYYGTISIDNFDIQDRTASASSYQYMSIYMGNPTSMVTLGTDPSNMVVVVQFISGYPFSSFPSSTKCSLQAGIKSNDPLKPITCEIDTSSNHQIIFRNVHKFTGNYLNFYYYATNPSSSFYNMVVQLRVYANSDAYSTSGGWMIFYGTSSNYNMTQQYFASATSYNVNNSAPNLGNYDWSETISSTSEIDTNGWVKITSVSSNSISFQMYKGTSISFPSTYKMTFRFYVDKLSFSGGCSVSSFTIGGKGTPSCSASNKYIQITYSYFSTNNGNNVWPTWSSGSSYYLTISTTVSGYSGTDYLFVTMTYTWQNAQYYINNQNSCGYCYCTTSGCCFATCTYCSSCYDSYWGTYYDCYCYNDCCHSTICAYYQCTWFYGVDSQMLTGKTTPYSPPATSFFASASGDLISQQYGYQTQLMIQINSVNMNIGPTYNSYILIVSDQNPSHTNNNPFRDTSDAQLAANIQCLCIVSSSISISYSTPYVQPQCVRYKPANGLQPSIGIFIDVPSTQSLRCYFPGYTVASSASNNRLNLDFFLNRNHFFRSYIPATYWQIYAVYDSINIGYTGTGLSSTLTFNQLGSFWSNDLTTNSRYYQLNMTSPYNTNYPTVYMAMYAPQPVTAFCSYSIFSQCRVYTSFINRKYYVVATSTSSSISYMRWNGTCVQPISDDYSSSYFTTYVGWGPSTDTRYYHVYTRNIGTSYLSPSTPSYNIIPSIYGNNLGITLSGTPSGYPTSLIFAVNLNGKTIKSSSITYGQYRGSFIKLTLSGFSSLYSCGATLKNRPRSLDNPFYCQIISSSVLYVYAQNTIIMTDYLYITLYTNALPSSTTYTFQLYDKYISGSDYARTVYVSQSFSRTPTGSDTLVQKTSVQWRQQRYKQYLTTSGPFRFTLNNNFQYVSQYNQSNNSESQNSDALIFYIASGISSSDLYFCFVKQYLPGSKSRYKQFQAPCQYYATNKIRIKPLPSYTFKPIYYYEFAVYRHQNGQTMLITIPTSDVFNMAIQTVTSLSSQTIVNYDILPYYKYKSVYPIILNHIYILNKQAAAINSLYLSFTVNIAGSTFNYFQFQISDLGLSNFKISNGDQISCYLSATFTSTKTQGTRCLGFSGGINEDSPLKIRIIGLSSWSNPTTFNVAFDNFNNPSLQPLFLVPINIKIIYNDRTNNRIYRSYWPSVYLSDSVNIGSQSSVSGSLTLSNYARGANTNHYIATSWPYSSTYSDISQKIVLKIGGGITCCQSFNSLSLSDSQTSYTLLWTDKIANMSVYRTPTKSISTSTNLYINNVYNPYPYQKWIYENLKTVQIIFYNSYQTSFIKNVAQLNYTQYSALSQFLVTSSLSNVDSTRSYYYHNQYPMTFDIALTSSLGSYPNRQLSYTLINFVNGVSNIQWATARYQISPYYFNSLQQVTFGRDLSNNWYLNISGMSESNYDSTYDWFIRIRFYPNANYVNYTSTTYCTNGQVQFTSSLQNQYIYNNNYRSGNNAPTELQPREKRYTQFYYQIKRKPKFASPGSTNSKIQFRFTSPYNIVNEQQINFISNSNVDIMPANTPTNLYCIIQQTVSSKVKYGVGRWAKCSFNTNTFIVTNPIGGLTSNTQYTITILERNQTTSSFLMPTSPKRIQISLIYTSQLNLQYGDVYQMDFSGLMTSYYVNHLSRATSALNMIGFTFTPQFTLISGSTTAPIVESVLQISIPTKYIDKCASLATIYSNDGMYFASGSYLSHYSSPSVTNSNTRIRCGDYSQSYTPLKLSVTDYGQFTAGTSYYFRFPLLKNSGTQYAPFTYNVRLLRYDNNVYYPTIVNQYTYQNLEYTQNGNSYGQYCYLNQSNSIIQNSVNVGFYWNSYYPGTGDQVILKWHNNAISALTSLTGLTSLSNSYYNYEYYPNINLCVFIKTSSNSNKYLALGSFTTSIDQQSYQVSWVYSYTSQTQIITSNFFYTLNKVNTLSYISSWSTASLSKLYGIQSTYSMGLYRITFSSSSLVFPEGSYIIIQITSTLVILDQFCYQFTGFSQGISLTTSNLACKKYDTDKIIISGFSTIGVGSTLTVSQYLQVNTGSIGSTNIYATITVYSSNNNIIISDSTSAYVLSRSQYGGYFLQLPDQMNYDLMKDTASQFYFTFQLRTHSLTSGQYISVDFGNWTIDSASLGSIMCKYKVGSNPYWVPFVFSKLSANIYKMQVYTNVTTYSIPVNQLVTVWIYHVNPDSFNGVLVSNITWNYLKITACQSDGTVLQHQYSEIWIQPFEHISLNVAPALTYINAISMYQFTVTPNISASVGDFILIEFTTDDQYYTNLFSQNLGKTVIAGSFIQISCRQTNNAHIISDSNIKCLLFPGDISLSPSIPTTIKIYIEKNIPVNTLISFNVLSLQNPSISAYPIGITLKLANICYSLDKNNPCIYYKSTKYLTFNPSNTPPGITGSYGSLTFNPNIISATNAQHILSASISLSVGDFIKIIYYNQVIVPQSCTLLSANAVCYSYPLENTIVIKVINAQSSPYSFTLTGMTNLYQYKGSNLYTQIWKASTGTISNRFYTQYSVGVIYTDPTSSAPLSIAFTPTLTPNYQLKYKFQNIAKIQISYIMQNANIQQIFLQAPSLQIKFLSYCNATMESDITQAKPYPYRFQCQVLNQYQIRLTKQSDFPAWNNNHINRKIIIYLMYTIQDGVGSSCSNWYATAFTDTSSSSVTSSTTVSQAVGNFNIIPYKSPYIYQINFPTQSFSKRTCTTGQLCMFYGYLLPSTLQSSYQISYINFGIPKQFGYSNLVTYTKCQMMESNSDSTSVSCQATKNNSQVSLRFTPTPYNMNYKLITIDTANSAQLFKTPEYPGNMYQMKVDLYTNTQLLIQSQLINITTVYGVLLQYNYLNFIIPQDANAIGLFEFTFKVGIKDVLPSYPNTKSNTVTSSIQIIFSNTFKSDLGTGFTAGQQIACLPIFGLTLNTMGKLTCKIYPSVSTITYPTIIITGYDRILANTTVTIRAAGLQSLSTGISDYIKIGVSLSYFDYGGSKGYIYQPTGKIVGPTTIANSPKTITAAVNQTSSNFVGQLVNYTFTCTIDTTTGFQTVKTTDYIGVQFPSYGFQGRFNMNDKALCSIASSSKCYSFGLANVVYFQPSTAISSSSLNFNLNQMINTAFAYQYLDITIKVFSVVDNKVNALGSAVLRKFSKPSMNISGLITKIDSIYGGQSGINYYIDFKLGTYLPQLGKISILFPSVFTSLFTLRSSCNFSQSSMTYLGQGPFCEVVNSYQIVISANGILFDSSQTYQIIVSNLTNPNMNISNLNFLISSYYSSDIYYPKIISSNAFKGPSLNVLQVKSCQFQLSVQALNQNFQSNYNIILICPSYIKQASQLQIYLPWTASTSSGQICSSSTKSLYSYQCDINNAYVGTSLNSYIAIYLRQNSPQKQIQISGQMLNGIRGTYKLKANISYSGFIYLTAISNQFYLQQSSLLEIASFGVNINNYPLNAGYSSIYTFKMTNPNITANSLKIKLPNSINQGKDSLNCRFENWNTSKNYFTLLTNKEINNIPCSMSKQTLAISNISTLINKLGSNQFWFIIVEGLINPDISSANSTFTFTFMNLSSDNTGLITGEISKQLAYKVSSPPSNLQIKSMQIDNSKLGVIANYSFDLTTISGNNIIINSQSIIGLKIAFPAEYLLIWLTIQVPTTITLTLGSIVYTSSNITMISGKLLAYFNVPNNNEFSTASFSFKFRNPSTSLSCNITPVFTVSLFDFKLNSIVAQTISNNIECPKLSDRLYNINISGNSQIQAGGSSRYSIQIQKPAKYLLITPQTSATAISFYPKQIQFSNYNQTVKYFYIIASSTFSGSFVVQFVKTQNGSPYYNDMSNQTVSVIAPIANYIIAFNEINVKSIGIQIPVAINLSVPPTTSFNLLYSHNCTSLGYKIFPADRIPLVTSFNTSYFSVVYLGSKVPAMCSINFKISSLTANNYILETSTLYISATVSNDKTNKIPPMIMKITKTQQQSQYIGFSIFNQNSTSTNLKPVIYSLNQTSNGSNAISMTLSCSQPGQVYYVALSLATQKKDITHQIIYYQKITTAISYGNTSALLISAGKVNIEANFSISGLDASNVYLIGAYVNSSVGLSEIYFQTIQTSKSSNGAMLKLALTGIQTNSSLINALSSVLRIQTSRISIVKINTPLAIVSPSNNGVLNARKYVYEIVVAPNTLNDVVSPISILNNFTGSDYLIGKLSQKISSLDTTYKMSSSELIYAKPRIRSGIKIIQLTNQNIRVSINSWEKANFYGVIVPFDSKGSALLSKQIIQGLDRNNKLLNEAYRVSNTTDDQGYTQLNFRLLLAETKYEIFITAESVIAFNPKPRLADEDVLHQNVQTAINLNIADNKQKIVDVLRSQNQPQLAQAVRQHLLSVEQKKMANGGPSKIRNRK